MEAEEEVCCKLEPSCPLLSYASTQRHLYATVGLLALSSPAGMNKVRSFVFERKDDFPEIKAFMRQMDEQYQLQLELLTGNIKPGLESFLRQSKVQAIVLGTRR